jgi:hypothetical protein
MGAPVQAEASAALAARKWICEISAERVGSVWRAEDHEALVRTMRAADQLTEALIALARRDAAKTTTTNAA